MLLGIYGSGGLGREVMDLARTINGNEEKWHKIVFINDYKEQHVAGQIEYYTLDDFNATFSADKTVVVIAVGEPKVRLILRDKVITYGFSLQTLMHPSAFIGSNTQIGNGTIIQYGSFVSCDVKIGTNVLVQPFGAIGHDSVVGDDTVISENVAVSGTCSIGTRVYIGVGVPIKECTTIGADSIIGMGSVVLRDIPEGVIAMGNPARPLKNNETGRVFN